MRAVAVLTCLLLMSADVCLIVEIATPCGARALPHPSIATLACACVRCRPLGSRLRGSLSRAKLRPAAAVTEAAFSADVQRIELIQSIVE